MKSLNIFVAGALVAALLLVGTQKARSIYSSPVTVTNTSANAVPTSDSGIRFQTDICNVNGTVSTATGNCPAGKNTFTVPTTTSSGASVKTLVVDNVSGFCSSFNNPSLVVTAVRLRGNFVPDSVPNGNATFTHYIPMAAPGYSYVNDPSIGPPYAGVPESDYIYGQTTHLAFSQGDTVSVETFYSSTGVGANDFVCITRIEGYLVPQ